jgi:hypothetical protein
MDSKRFADLQPGDVIVWAGSIDGATVTDSTTDGMSTHVKIKWRVDNGPGTAAPTWTAWLNWKDDDTVHLER